MKQNHGGRAVTKQPCDDWSIIASKPTRPKRNSKKHEPVGLIVSVSLVVSSGLMMLLAHFLS